MTWCATCSRNQIIEVTIFVSYRNQRSARTTSIKLVETGEIVLRRFRSGRVTMLWKLL